MTHADRVIAQQLTPLDIGWIDFAVEPLFGWTGPGMISPSGTGDAILDANTFSPVKDAVDLSDITDNMRSGGPVDITYSAHDNDAEAVRQVIRDRRIWQLRRVKIWRCFLQPDGKTVHPEFVQRFSGVIRNAKQIDVEGQPSVFVLQCGRDGRFSTRGGYRLTDHVRENPTDTYSSFLIPLSNGKFSAATRAPGRAITSGAGAGGEGSGRFFKDR